MPRRLRGPQTAVGERSAGVPSTGRARREPLLIRELLANVVARALSRRLPRPYERMSMRRLRAIYPQQRTCSGRPWRSTMERTIDAEEGCDEQDRIRWSWSDGEPDGGALSRIRSRGVRNEPDCCEGSAVDRAGTHLVRDAARGRPLRGRDLQHGAG